MHVLVFYRLLKRLSKIFRIYRIDERANSTSQPPFLEADGRLDDYIRRRL